MWDKANQWQHLKNNRVYYSTACVIIAGGVLDLVGMGKEKKKA